MSRRIEVDSQMLAEGMKITFFGISTVFASMGIPDEAVKFLGIRGPEKESLEKKEPQADQNAEEERPVPYVTGAENARPQVSASKDIEPQDAKTTQAALDEIIRVIKRKIQDDPENSDRIRSILNNKYKKEKVQGLSEDSYEAFLKEIRAI